MVLSIKIGLLSIPIMVVNYSNNRYSVSGLHQFSECCSSPVGNKKYCKECGKDLTNTEIRKGLSKDRILTDEQSEALKEHLESGLMEVVAIKDYDNEVLLEVMPFIQKTQLILPSISKGYRKTDIKTFYSFVSALKENNKFCIVKLVQRALEHLGVLVLRGDDLLFIELPFKSYNNLSEIKRLKEAVENNIQADKITELEIYKEQAQKFISAFENKAEELDLVVEEKQQLIKQMIEEIKLGVKPIIKEVENPFEI